MNLTDFFNSKKIIEEKKYSGTYRMGEFYKYENAIMEIFEKIESLKESDDNLLYQSELTNILINFYEGIFNIMDKLASEMKNGNNNNQAGFNEFFEFLKQVYIKLLDSSNKKTLKVSNNINIDTEPSIENYLKIKNEINSYIKKLYNLFSKTKDLEIMDFAIEEQKIVMISFYEGLLTIAKKMKEEIEKGKNDYSGTMYFIMMELERIINNISENDLNFKENTIAMTYKTNNFIE